MPIAGQIALPVLSDTYGDEDHHYVATARRIGIDLQVYLGTSLYMPGVRPAPRPHRSRAFSSQFSYASHPAAVR